MNEIYQILFYASVFYLVRMLIILLLKFRAFRSANAAKDVETAKTIMFTLTREDKYLLIVSIGTILAFLI